MDFPRKIVVGEREFNRKFAELPGIFIVQQRAERAGLFAF